MLLRQNSSSGGRGTSDAGSKADSVVATRNKDVQTRVPTYRFCFREREEGREGGALTD